MFRLAIAVATAFVWLIGPFAKDNHAQAEIHIAINKAAQRMTVMVDGRPRYNWAISSGLNGGPPSGTFRPQRLERMWHSRTYDWSPMPHSIFFHHGFAIHGTNYVSRLGRPASHGCVRLHPSNAATLFTLVKSYGMGKTTIAVSDSRHRMAHR